MKLKMSNSAVKQANTEDTENISTTVRVPKPLKPEALQWNSQSNFIWREGELTLSPDHTLADLNDHPAILFRNIMQDRDKSLVRGDTLRIVPHNRAWMIRSAVVVTATPERVKLAFKAGDKIDLEDLASDAAWQDGTVEVRWYGAGYAVLRKSDGVKVVPGYFPDPQAAVAAWQRGKPVAM